MREMGERSERESRSRFTRRPGTSSGRVGGRQGPAGGTDFRPRGSRSRDNRARCSPVRNRRGDARRAVRKSRRGMAYDHSAVRAFPPLSSRTPDFPGMPAAASVGIKPGRIQSPSRIARRATTPAGPPYERASGVRAAARVRRCGCGSGRCQRWRPLPRPRWSVQRWRRSGGWGVAGVGCAGGPAVPGCRSPVPSVGGWRPSTV